MYSSAATGRVIAWPYPINPSPRRASSDNHPLILPGRDKSIGAPHAAESHDRFRRESSSPALRPQAEAESERLSKVLRVKLLQAMSAALQAVDFTTKTWESGQVEIALYVAREHNELASLSESILTICRELREVEQADQKHSLPIGCIETIAVALSSICRHAKDASLQFAAFQGTARHEWLKDLVPLGECITRSLRLCVVAFANREIGHAVSAIREIDDCRWIYSQSQDARIVKQSGEAGFWYQKSIAADLVRMMENVHIVALQLNCAAVYDI